MSCHTFFWKKKNQCILLILCKLFRTNSIPQRWLKSLVVSLRSCEDFLMQWSVSINFYLLGADVNIINRSQSSLSSLQRVRLLWLAETSAHSVKVSSDLIAGVYQTRRPAPGVRMPLLKSLVQCTCISASTQKKHLITSLGSPNLTLWRSTASI